MNSTYPHIFFPHLKTRDHSWEKIRRAFKYAYYRTKGSFDWYLRADDDAFVIMENANKFLQNYNASKDYLFGFRWGHFEPTGYADGGSYILSRTAMESFIEVMKEKKTCPEFHRAEEDQELSRCLSRVGIFPEDTRDNYGRERFHHFHPDEERNNFMKKMFLKRNAYYSHEWYPEHVSDTTISFHHLSPYEM
uniref:N-acetylgalactosaminide beta-1,3-galactosyltransferase n=1 Tax=Acrobeloides nanus TaxID=290746 RepID=A0A914C485_9BILA